MLASGTVAFYTLDSGRSFISDVVGVRGRRAPSVHPAFTHLLPWNGFHCFSAHTHTYTPPLVQNPFFVFPWNHIVLVWDAGIALCGAIFSGRSEWCSGA